MTFIKYFSIAYISIALLVFGVALIFSYIQMFKISILFGIIALFITSPLTLGICYLCYRLIKDIIQKRNSIL